MGRSQRHWLPSSIDCHITNKSITAPSPGKSDRPMTEKKIPKSKAKASKKIKSKKVSIMYPENWPEWSNYELSEVQLSQGILLKGSYRLKTTDEHSFR